MNGGYTTGDCGDLALLFLFLAYGQNGVSLAALLRVRHSLSPGGDAPKPQPVIYTCD